MTHLVQQDEQRDEVLLVDDELDDLVDLKRYFHNLDELDEDNNSNNHLTLTLEICLETVDLDDLNKLKKKKNL
jgi:hypothetical protein